jgi:competence protein ComEC
MYELFERTHNRLIFPAAAASLTSLFYYTEHWQYRAVFAGFFLWICLRNGRATALLCLCCSLLVFLSCWLKEVPLVETEAFESVFQVYADTIKANGDLITFDARLMDQKNQKIRGSYQVSSEEERTAFLSWRKETFFVQAAGAFSLAEPLRNAYGFDQEKHYRNQRIAAQFRITELKEIHFKNSNLSFFHRFRGAQITKIQENFPVKTAVYLNALLFGYRDHTFEESQQVFRETGLLHLFSLSGMHVQIYLGWIYYLFRRSGWRIAHSVFPLCMLAFCYTLIAGSGVSVLRAGILFSLRLLVKAAGHRFSELDLFAATLWICLIIEPLVLLQVGGQLSFAITFLLTFLSSKPDFLFKLHQAFLLNIATMPLITWHFFEWPLIGSFLTLFFVPVFAYFLLPLLFGLFFFQAWLPTFFLSLVESGLNRFERFVQLFGFSVQTVGRFPEWICAAAVISLLLIAHKYKERPLKAGLFSLCIPFFFLVSRHFGLEASITFIDVGQGDSIFLKAPGGRETILIDTGGRIDFSPQDWRRRQTVPLSDRNVVPFLKGQGISKIDKLILTHDDTDHTGELSNLAEHFQIGTIYIGWGAAASEAVQEDLTSLALQGAAIKELKQGDRSFGYFDLHVLYPEKKGQGKNEDSLAIWLQQAQTSFLLLGDLYKESELAILKTYPGLSADVVKLGHHGSRTSTHPHFIESVNASEGIVSSGRNNSFGHPHPEVLEVLAENQMEVLRTDESGMIRYRWHPLLFSGGKREEMID